MAFSPENRKGTIVGIRFVPILLQVHLYCNSSSSKSFGSFSFGIGIVIGIFYANTLHNHIPEAWESGITFSAKKILRFAIVIYGLELHSNRLPEVGLEGFLVSLIMLSSTFILGTGLGHKIFKMEKDTAMLTASGASVCGAAAV